MNLLDELPNGLLSQKLPSGRHERCSPEHSWNSNHVITNLFLYQLQRHADHHANPTHRFQALLHFDDSPHLPSGYASMLLLAYVPPLWFLQMDPLIVSHYEGDLSKANIYAPKREKLLKRWANARVGDGQPERYPKSEARSAGVGAGVECEANCYQCTDCGYVYDETVVCPHEGFAAGTPKADIPNDWPCPDCAVREKVDFKPLTTER